MKLDLSQCDRVMIRHLMSNPTREEKGTGVSMALSNRVVLENNGKGAVKVACY